ncbi:MAG: DUF2339 domain-containing protein [Coriobacteriaceae bacterium]|jgi:hypothetical protein|nr:DUF2339 domain-containing protein [Coriobacteriaceae bacterium]
MPPQPSGSKPVKDRSFENIFGKNILGIAAAILVFLGLIFLGFLVVPSFTDMVKIILMFFTSLVLTAGGYLLNRRYANNFTKALLGTGLGAFFISIQMTHLYFNALNEIATFAFLLVWMAASFFIARQTESLLVAIVAHAGMVFSVCAGYSVGISDEKVLLLLVYQLVSTVLIVVGNLFCCKKMYRFGLFASLFLTVFASVVMWSYFMGSGASFHSSLAVPLIAGAFVIQFLGSSFLSYLLFVSIVRTKNSGVQIPLQMLNLLLWLLALGVDIALLLGKLYLVLVNPASAFPFETYESIPLALAVCLALVYGVAFLIVLLRRKLTFDSSLENFTVLFLVIASCLALVIQLTVNWFDSVRLLYPFAYSQDPSSSINIDLSPSILYFIVPMLACVAFYRLTRSQLFIYSALVCGAIDAAHLFLSGYGELTRVGTAGLSFGYLLLLLAAGFLLYRITKDRQHFAEVFKIWMLVVFEVSATSIAVFHSGQRGIEMLLYTQAFLLIVLLIPLLVLRFIKKDTPASFFRVNEFCVILLACLMLSSYGENGPLLPVAFVYGVAILLALFLVFDRLRRLAFQSALALRDPSYPFPRTNSDILSAIAIHLLGLSAIQNLTSLFDLSFSFSFFNMVLALVIVGCGFWTRARWMRLYGLVITLLCVLKLVLLDVGGLDAPMRVVAFIGGGIICFGISALYNFAVKRFKERED